MPNSARFLRFCRKIHLYFGIFISPALLFFAFTGALQTFSLHETTAGSSYKPPAWIAELAQLHKKQTLALPARKPRPEAAKPDVPGLSGTAVTGDGAGKRKADAVAGAISVAAGPAPKRHLPMKIFFLVVSIGLFTSTCTGLYMAYRYERNRWMVNGLLAAGVLVPLLLMRF